MGGQEHKNVIVIMADQFKATASHLYGNPDCTTPSLERLAASGVLYQNAFTPHPLCVPARISFWTSQYSHTHGSQRNQTLMPTGADHAFRRLKDAGFNLGLIGKNHCLVDRDDLDLFDVWCEIGHRGFEGGSPRGMDWVRSPDAVNQAHAVRKNMPIPEVGCPHEITRYEVEDYSTALVGAQTVKYLEENRDNRFALWVSLPDPHPPYETHERYASMFPPETLELPPTREDEFGNAPLRNRILHEILGSKDNDRADLRATLGIYYGMVRFVDDQLGEILDALERLGLRENTIVVFCSDHGDFAGEHGMMNKGGVFYDCLTRVPLVLSLPGEVPEGGIDDSLVNLIDVVPTLFSLLGLEIPQSFEGLPLPTATAAAPRDAAFSEYGAGGPPFTWDDLDKLPVKTGVRALGSTLLKRESEGRRRMIRTSDWKYVSDTMGDLDELYDLRSDPWELDNLADRPEYHSIRSELGQRLSSW